MTPKDLEVFKEFLNDFALVPPVVMHSPWPDQVEAVRSTGITPTVISRADWDIRNPTGRRFTTIILQNVLHYIDDPFPVLDHLRQAADWVVVQDLINRNRGGGQELCNDGDAMRYSIGSSVSSFPRAFDLNPYHRVFLREYDDGPARHFLAVFPGYVNQAR